MTTRYLTVAECDVIGVRPHAVYGGKVYSFVDKDGRIVAHGTSWAYADAVHMVTPAPNRRKQATIRRARHTAEMRKLKLVPRQVWAHLDDWPDVTRYVTRKNRARLKPG